MTHYFKFGKPYIKIVTYEQALTLLPPDISRRWCYDNGYNYGTHSPVGTYGTSGSSGTNNNYPQKNMMGIKKYYFNGKYPKPK